MTDSKLAKAAQQQPAGTRLHRTETPYHTAIAVQVARDMESVKRDALAEARLMGDAFFYQWDVQTKDDGAREVLGLTIDGAMALIRNWGNAVCIPEVVAAVPRQRVHANINGPDDEPAHWVFRASFVDLEKGSTIVRLYQKTRSKAPGRMGNTVEGRQRWSDMQFSDGQSRAVRNAVKHALPAWLVRQCIEAAITGAQQGVNPQKERGVIIHRAKRLGVSIEQIQRKMGRRIEEFDARDLVTIRALIRTVEEEHASVEDLFGPKTMSPKKLGESLADQFEKRLASASSWADGEVVRTAIKDAMAKDDLTGAEYDTLVAAWKKHVVPMRPRDSDKGAAQPSDRKPGEGDE